jgi:hypothetical protein
MVFWWWFGWGLLAAQVVVLLPVIYGLLFPRRLGDVESDAGDTGGEWPAVSIIVPARDEGAHVEGALQSFLSLDYPYLEVIAIDDRSTDGTGETMERVAAGDDRCRVVHVKELPDGWLGKNHANALGARQSTGRYILFTDGDVRMKPLTLRRAVTHMERRRLDHFSLAVDGGAASFGEQMMMGFFIVLYSIVTKCAWTRFRWAWFAHGGVGAFNMVRRSAYEAIGGHQPLRLEVGDDIMMGKLFKKLGYRADFMDGMADVYVKWQTGVSGIIRGLEKNGFAGARYSLPTAIFGSLAQPFFAWLPLVLVVTGPARLPFVCVIGVKLAVMVGCALRTRMRILPAAAYPIASVLIAYALLRSTWITLRDGGVTWRDTFYPLAQLREGRVR